MEEKATGLRLRLILHHLSWCCLFLIGFASVPALAQEYLVENYGVKEGLNTSELYHVMQDSRGYLWVGTDHGLSRFDGYRFINYTSADGVRLSDVWICLEDTDGTIWVGSGEGLFFVRNNTIYATPWRQELGLTYAVHDLLLDGNGNLWVGGGSGPLKILRPDLERVVSDPEYFRAVEVVPAWTNADLIDHRVLKMALDQDGHLLVGNSHYLTRIADEELTILVSRLDARSRMTQLKVAADGTIIWSAEGGYVYATTGDGTTPLNTRAQYISDFQGDRDSMLILAQPHALYEHKENQASLLLYLPEEVHYPKSLTTDREGNIWIASFAGLFKIRSQAVTQHHWNGTDAPENIYGLEVRADGHLLLGGVGGEVWEMDSQNPLATEKIATVCQRSQVIDFHEDNRGAFWVATYYQGLFVKQDRDWVKLDDRPPLQVHTESYFFIYAPATDQVWVGGEQAVSCITLVGTKDFSFESFMLQDSTGPDISVLIHNAARDQTGKMWFASNKGLLKIGSGNLQTHKLSVDGTLVEEVSDIATDQLGNIWLATPDLGLLQCRNDGDGNLQLTEQWDTKKGLYSDIFIDLLVDRNGRLWAAGNDGVCRIDLRQDSPEVLCLDHTSGYTMSGYSFLDMVEDSSGHIWVGTSAGLASIDPTRIAINQVPALPHLENILIDDREIDHTTWSDGNLTLPYHENFLSFTYNAISLTNPAGIRYQYQLVGADRDWQVSTNPTTINYPNLRPGEYAFKLKASNSDGVWSPEEIYVPFEIRPPFWGRWWFWPGLILISFTSLIYYFRRREKIVQHRQAEENRVTKLISELKIRALRSQMNPHFIFNCLNSIQACIGEQNPDVASHYLAKFSTLLRTVLNNSDKNLVTMDKEIEFLTLYLDLEKLRFGETFEYLIEVDEEIDPEEIKLPSFLVQPFVENSIWHGLMHKEGNRKLWVRFNLSDDEDHLLCTIEDNGVGRKQSLENNRMTKNRINHQSKGMSLSTDRIELIKLQSHQDAQFEIIDLADAMHEPIGTKVILTLPSDLTFKEYHA